MEIRLLVHAEPGETGSLVWWIESPDIPGFSGAGDGLVEARLTSERAIRDLLAEQGTAEPITFSYELMDPPADEGVAVEWTGEAGERSEAGVIEVSRVA